LRNSCEKPAIRAQPAEHAHRAAADAIRDAAGVSHQMLRDRLLLNAAWALTGQHLEHQDTDEDREDEDEHQSYD
jgi:hypothetical protein